MCVREVATGHFKDCSEMPEKPRRKELQREREQLLEEKAVAQEKCWDEQVEQAKVALAQVQKQLRRAAKRERAHLRMSAEENLQMALEETPVQIHNVWKYCRQFAENRTGIKGGISTSACDAGIGRMATTSCTTRSRGRMRGASGGI